MARSISVVAVVFLLAGVAFGQPCPEGEWCQWIVAERGNGHWYRLTESETTWQAAEDEAVAAGGHLVTINNAPENQWLLDTFGDSSFAPFIGFNDQVTENHWVWVAGNGGFWDDDGGTGSGTSFVNWNQPGDPNNGNGQWEEDVAVMLTNQFPESTQGKWNDGDGTNIGGQTPRQGIIELEGDPSVPTVSQWGMIAMTILILTAGTLVFGRRRRQVAA